MCGIAGIVSLDGRARQGQPAIRAMVRSMRHRGPDGEGFLVAWAEGRGAIPLAGEIPVPADGRAAYLPADNIDDHGAVSAQVFLGHRRLAILGLTHLGQQPMSTPDRRYWIVYNGEIFNFSEIARELKEAGVDIFTGTDTEVLLQGFRLWGPSVLDRLTGMFAFAIWDDRDKTLFCARDRIGIKPFYYTAKDGVFVFGSDIKTLIASELYDPEMDLEGLYHALSYGVAPRPMTCFKDVRALEQGCWMRICPDGRMETERYWRIPVGTQDQGISEATAVSMVEEGLYAAVGRCLVSDVPVATFLSGGIDSTTMTAMAADQVPGTKAFTLSYGDYAPEMNETENAVATAAMYPISHSVKEIDDRVNIEELWSIALCHEEPFHTIAPNFVISKFAAENGAKVCLTGLGGDELFGGYPYYAWAAEWSRVRRLRWLTPILRFMNREPQPAWMMDVATPDRLEAHAKSISSEEVKQSLFMPNHVESFNTIDRLHELYVGDGITFSDPVEAISYMDLMNYIGNHFVYRVDQFTMHFSMEGRFPFLDHHLIETAFKIPSRHKVSRGVFKHVLRLVAKEWLPTSCLAMDKKGFGLPLDKWMRGPLRGFMEDLIRSLGARDMFRRDEIDRRRKGFFEGTVTVWEYWQLAAVEMWFRSFIDGHPVTEGISDKLTHAPAETK